MEWVVAALRVHRDLAPQNWASHLHIMWSELQTHIVCGSLSSRTIAQCLGRFLRDKYTLCAACSKGVGLGGTGHRSLLWSNLKSWHAGHWQACFWMSAKTVSMCCRCSQWGLSTGHLPLISSLTKSHPSAACWNSSRVLGRFLLKSKLSTTFGMLTSKLSRVCTLSTTIRDLRSALLQKVGSDLDRLSKANFKDCMASERHRLSGILRTRPWSAGKLLRWMDCLKAPDKRMRSYRLGTCGARSSNVYT